MAIKRTKTAPTMLLKNNVTGLCFFSKRSSPHSVGGLVLIRSPARKRRRSDRSEMALG
jgi:hypothetical protein